jgi:glycosyltransferase involved in cell wall biosynthesis
MKLSIIIPCYNEIERLPRLIRLVKQSPVEDKEIILVDDGSTDGTTELIWGELEALVDRVVRHSTNRGKGAAIRSALEYVTGDIVVIQDADLEYDPEEYPKLMAPVVNGKADVVYGSRFISDGPHRVHLFWHYVGNRILTLLSNMLTNLNLTDMETGFKLFKTDIIKALNLRENRFGIEPEITAKIARTQCRIYEVGISYYGRSYKEGKKITWKDGMESLYKIIVYNIFS